MRQQYGTRAATSGAGCGSHVLRHHTPAEPEVLEEPTQKPFSTTIHLNTIFIYLAIKLINN